MSLTLFGHYSGFYGDVDLWWPDGSEVVTWSTDGDHPGPGFTAEPAVGPIEFYPTTPLGSQGQWRGIRVLAAGLLNISVAGGFGGVASDHSEITVALRQNGVIIHSETQTGPSLGLYSFIGSFNFSLTDIAAAAGDEFEVSVIWPNAWAGFQFFATNPGDTATNTHFRVTGTTQFDEPTTGAPIGPGSGSDVTAETPTPGPDGSVTLFTLAHRYVAGTLQVWVDGILIPASAVTETDPAAGTFTLSWAPDADEQILTAYRVI
jgi:hypothetical protein